MRVVLKELNETSAWLRMAVRSNLISAEMATNILDECEQLIRIVAKSIKTATGS
jgi:four helix bundle protein